MILMNLFEGQQCRCRPREKTWEEGEGGMTGERLCNKLEGWERVEEVSTGRGQ